MRRVTASDYWFDQRYEAMLHTCQNGNCTPECPGWVAEEVENDGD